jgi:hypothetical protein
MSHIYSFSQKIFHFSRNNLLKLKALVQKSDSHSLPQLVSTNDCLCALLWRALTRARNIPLQKLVPFGQAINGRDGSSAFFHSSPEFCIPKSYFGCALFFQLIPNLSASQVLSSPLSDLAQLIRTDLTKIRTSDFMKSAVQFLHKQPQKSSVMATFLPRTVGVTSWAQFPIYALDFGCGPPLKVLVAPPSGKNGFSFILPHKNDGLEVYVGMEEEFLGNLSKDEEMSLYCTPVINILF